MRSLWACAVLLAAPTLWACGDDEVAAPPYREDMAELLTDANAAANRLVPDDADTLRVVGSPAVSGAEPSSTYRVRALYVAEAGQAHLYDVVSVLAPEPRAYNAATHVADPLDVVAIWRGGRYLNFRLSVLTAGGGHAFAFAQRELAEQAGGYQLLRLALYHAQGDDPMYYSRTVYLSCPLAGYADQLQAGRDSVEVEVATHAGPYVRRFAY